MAAAPKWKVYDGDTYIAACKFIEDAAALVAARGEGSSIRAGHEKRFTVWHEGHEDQEAAESYDFVAEVATSRLRAIAREGNHV